jgi:Holliday junction resolvase RusA-like endonuclease
MVRAKRRSSKADDYRRARDYITRKIDPEEYETLDDYLKAVEDEINTGYVKADRKFYEDQYSFVKVTPEELRIDIEPVYYEYKGKTHVRWRDPYTKKFVKSPV